MLVAGRTIARTIVRCDGALRAIVCSGSRRGLGNHGVPHSRSSGRGGSQSPFMRVTGRPYRAVMPWCSLIVLPVLGTWIGLEGRRDAP